MSQTAPGRHESGPTARDCELPFGVRVCHRANWVADLRLCGEFDLAAAPSLAPRVAWSARAGYRVRLDLSRLTFIDCAGLTAMLALLGTARHEGWDVQVDDEASPVVRRLCALTGTSELLWPPIKT